MAVNSKRVFKTKRVLSGVRSEFHAWDKWDEGDTIIAKYLDSQTNKKNPSKKDWIVEIVEPMFADKAQNKRLKAGTRLLLNCAGQLDKGMARVDVGALVQVTYNGQQEMVGGAFAGKMAHLMEVTEVEDEADQEELDEEDESEDSDDDL